MNRQKILIYRDYGCSDLRELSSALNEYFAPKGLEVEYTDAAAIIKENALGNDVALFIMPGGAATPFLQKLKVLGNEKIKDYVAAGGNYLGICAGAYYACTMVEFEKDIEQLSIVRKNELLGLVKAKATGTLHKELAIRPYMKNEESGAAVRLKWQDNEIHYAHYHGGPKFEPYNGDFEVLARYDEVDGEPPAIVARDLGKGRIVLSGVHFEDRGDDLAKALHALRLDAVKAEKVAEVLRKNEPSRLSLFGKIMAQFEK